MSGFDKILRLEGNKYSLRVSSAILIIGSLLCFSANAVDQASTSEEEITTRLDTSNPAVAQSDNVRMLFQSSGLQELIKKIPTSTASSFESAITVDSLPEIFNEVDNVSIRNAVHGAFKFETFDKYMVKQLRQGMSDEGRTDMLSWYATDLGLRVREAELSNSLLTEQDRFEEYQRFLNRYPVSAKRMQLVTKLDDTLKATDAAVEMMVSIQIAFNLSMSRFLPEEQRFSSKEIQEMVKGNEQELLEQYSKQTKEVLLFTYQDLSDEELVQLEQKLATGSGQNFVAAINDGIKKGMFAASLDLGDGLGALIPNPNNGQGI